MEVFFAPDDDRFMVHKTSKGTVFGVPQGSAVDVLCSIKDASGVPKFGDPHPNRPYLLMDRLSVFAVSESSANIEVHYQHETSIDA